LKGGIKDEMIIKTITPEQFVEKYEEKGSLTGTFADAQEYLGWVLNSKGTENGKHFEETLEVFRKRFNMPYFTTKYLRGLINPDIKNKNQRIIYILEKAGYDLGDAKRYYRELRCVIRYINNIVYKNNEGIIAPEERKEAISRLANVFVGERLHPIIPQQEANRYKEITRQLNYFWTLSELGKMNFSKDKILTFQEPKDYQEEKLQEFKQERAISKLKQKEQEWNILNCAGCKREIKLPIYTDIKDEKIFDIINARAKDIKDGIAFCSRCQKTEDGLWRKEEIKCFLKKIIDTCQEKQGICFKAEDFSQEYRVDKAEMLPGYLKRVLDGFICEFEMDNNLLVMTNKDLLKIQVLKKN
jgi:hypothetical protein